MKNVVYNKDNISDKEVTDLVVRTKGLLISNGYLLLGNEDGTLQFPGGHLEENETLEECLKREILEETGIELTNEVINGPFLEIDYYNKDWPTKGNVRKCEIYYYAVETEKNINLCNTSYTKSEVEKHFKVDKVKLNEAIDFINNNIANNELNKVISPDMIIAIKEYLKSE